MCHKTKIKVRPHYNITTIDISYGKKFDTFSSSLKAQVGLQYSVLDLARV